MKQQYNRYMTELEDDLEDDDFEALITDDIDDLNQPEKSPEATTYFISYREVNPNQAHEIVDILANQTTEYALIQPDIMEPTVYFTDRYSDTQFTGVMIDTGAARISTTSKRQYQAYIKTFGLTWLNTSNLVSIRFSIGDISSIGSITLDMPIGTAEFYIVDTDTPFLLYLQDMDKIGVYYNNITDKIVYPGGS